jgi:hypothetical protein
MNRDEELRTARGLWRANLLRSLIAVGLLLWTIRLELRPSIPVYSRWGPIGLVSILTVAMLIRTGRCWRAFRVTQRAS